MAERIRKLEQCRAIRPQGLQQRRAGLMRDLRRDRRQQIGVVSLLATSVRRPEEYEACRRFR